ncbi:hypothetical protein HMPREF9303_0489 [Prevotella denticola CRIS 18C-A]|uniref:Uncharacterized protein n=1 Tax=Prevotella denticola CRIS 18C-A TaxID=944557 RepID=F0H3K9_9BACT|nr:hypothetical protein HMPREF9303_0489 [Prevotella denticola CRIS 18C-A]
MSYCGSLSPKVWRHIAKGLPTGMSVVECCLCQVLSNLPCAIKISVLHCHSDKKHYICITVVINLYDYAEIR